jgi:hypothetical protein
VPFDEPRLTAGSSVLLLWRGFGATAEGLRRINADRGLT